MALPDNPAAIHDPTVGGFPPSAWGDALNAYFTWIRSTRPFARVYNNANISIPDNTATALTFNTEQSDVGGLHSGGSPGRLTAPDTNEYEFGCCVEFDSDPTGVRSVQIRINGTGRLVSDARDAGATTGVAVPISTRMYLAAGDYIEVVVFQNSGAPLDVVAVGLATPALYLGATR